MERYYWALIAGVEGIGNATIQKIKAKFTSGEEVYTAPARLLEASHCFDRSGLLDRFLHYREEHSLTEIKEAAERVNCKIIIIEDDFYPQELKQIYNPPQVLYCKGKLPDKQKKIAVVGSRHSTAYGEQVAGEFARGLAKNNFTVVSGAAKGIDATAHWGALQAGGRTIGVLGCGIDVIYPLKNKGLYEALESNGTLLSEYPIGTKPLAMNFPARNRIIAGLCQGILVVEGAAKSGSLITAEFANNEGRDVFAVPGNIYAPNSRGTHHLIQEGAKLVTCVEDIVREYDREISSAAKGDIPEQGNLIAESLNLTEDEAVIYELLDYNIQLSADEIIYKVRHKVSNVSFVLLQMKLKGIINEINPNSYIKI